MASFKVWLSSGSIKVGYGQVIPRVRPGIGSGVSGIHGARGLAGDGEGSSEGEGAERERAAPKGRRRARRLEAGDGGWLFELRGVVPRRRPRGSPTMREGSSGDQ